MKTFLKISKIFCIIALIAMIFVIMFVHSSEQEKMIFDPTEMPDFENKLSFADHKKIPSDEQALIELAARIYKVANDNMQDLEKWTCMVDFSTTMVIPGILDIPIHGNRFVCKNDVEYYFTEYSIPGDGAGMFAGMAAKESSDFSMRSYVNIDEMDYMFSEKSYSPTMEIDEETGKYVITPNWDDPVPKKLWSTEQPVPVFHSKQNANFAQTTMIINERTIKSASIEYTETKEGNYYTLNLTLDTSVAETTEVALVELRTSSGFRNAVYYELNETIEI